MKYTPLGRCETPGQALEWASKLEPAYRAERFTIGGVVPGRGRIYEMLEKLMRNAQEAIETKNQHNHFGYGGLELFINEGDGPYVTLLAEESLARHIPEWPR